MTKTEHIFNLPDLGEGLKGGEIAECDIAVGDHVVTDQIAMVIETTKAAVELPMPFGGEVIAIHGAVGETIEVGRPLITLLTDEAPNELDTAPGGGVTHLVGQASGAAPVADAGPSLSERIARKKKTQRILPALRRLARDLDVDLAGVVGTGKAGSITEADIRAAAQALMVP